MTELRFDISQLFNQAFGLTDSFIKYSATGKDQEAYQALFKTAESIEVNEDNVFSHLGTPVAFPIKLKGGTYSIFEEGEVVEKRMGDLMLPFTSICSFRRAKIANETKVNGGRGTVREVYGHDDWHLRIQGLILKDTKFTEAGTEMSFPSNMVTALKEWDDLVDSVEITGKFFELLDIYKIFIEDIRFDQLRGRPHVIPFEIIAKSDEPLELVL